jgi:hypothetical protein
MLGSCIADNGIKCYLSKNLWVVMPWRILTFCGTLLLLSSEWSEIFEMLVFYHNTMQHHSPEDLNLNLHRHENLKSTMLQTVVT